MGQNKVAMIVGGGRNIAVGAGLTRVGRDAELIFQIAAGATGKCERVP
jgi:hypothetical protein